MDATSATIVMVGLILIIVLLNHLGKSSLNTSVTTWSDRQLLDRSRKFDRLLQASLAADDAVRVTQCERRLDEIRTELARRNGGQKAR